MSEALKQVGLPLEGTHHRGGDDACNIAAILSRVLRSGRAGRV
jgi:inhibitor of KinA sporulation pathway (predicted exonuclease)